MKKIITISFVLMILLAGSVNAGTLASISMQGLSFVSPETGEIVNGIVCVSNPISCAQGKIIGAIQGELLNTLAEASPEAAKAVSTFNQVKGYIDNGAEITDELQVNDQGDIEKGTIEFGQKQELINDFVGKDIENKAISVSNVQITKEEGISTITTKEKGFLVITKTNPETGEEKFFSYDNMKEGGKLELDEEGEVIGADFITNEQGGTYNFGSDQIDVPPNSQVLFKDSVVNVIVSERSGVKEFPTKVEGFGGTSNTIYYNGNGESITFPGHIQLQDGILGFRDGQAFIPKGGFSELNGVRINGGNRWYSTISQETIMDNPRDVPLFFDGKPHTEDSYFSMDVRNNNFIMSNKDDNIFNVEFNEVNPFF